MLWKHRHSNILAAYLPLAIEVLKVAAYGAASESAPGPKRSVPEQRETRVNEEEQQPSRQEVFIQIHDSLNPLVQPPFTMPLTFDEDGLPLGFVLIDRDILVPLESALRGNFVMSLWPQRRIPFRFEDYITPARRTIARQAFSVWEELANVNFVEHDNEFAHLFFMIPRLI